MQGHSIHEFPQTGQKDICMAVVKYTPFVLLDGAGSQKNQHQSVVGVARGYKVGNCTPGVPDKMSVVAAVAEPRPGRQKLGPGWPGLVIILSPGTARPRLQHCTTRRWTGKIMQRVHDPSCPAPGPVLCCAVC